jgi:uncharacterized protein (TIGR04222 family)
MNPLDLPGPEFLGLYVTLLLIAVVIALVLRWLLRLPADEPPFVDTLELTPYEVAYLAGADKLAVTAAMARLVHARVLEADGAGRKLTILRNLPDRAHPLEKAVFQSVRPKSGERVAKVERAALPRAAPLQKRLRELELVLAPERRVSLRLLALLPVLAVGILGIAKVMVGVERHRPVGFLVILLIVTGALLVRFLIVGSHRSRRGDRVLARIKQENAALESSARRANDNLAGDDLVLALGLFGTAILVSGPLASLQTALKPPPSTSSSGCSSSGCSSGCGGGCGGGGCGGCGG